MRKFLLATAATVLLLAPAQAETFTPEQKKAIGEIVRQYLLDNPEVLVEVSRKLEEKQRAEQQARMQAALKGHGDLIFNNPADPVLGDPKAKIAVVEFFDYNCGFCKRALKDLQKIVDAHKDAKIVFKEFPILGPGSDEAARIALAAQMQDAQKYWKLHQALMSYPGRMDGKTALAIAKKMGFDVERLKKDMNSDAVKSAILTNMQLADALGINGTPAFIIGDQLIRGAQGYDRLKDAIEAVREKASDKAGKKG